MNINTKDIIKKPEILYFDFAASGLAYKPIENKIQEILLTYANTHSEVSSNSIKTKEYYEAARSMIKKSLEIDDSFYIIPCGTGSSGAIKKFQEIIGIYIPPYTKERFNISINNKPLVIVGPYEHHANEISFREALCDVARVKLDKNYRIDFQDFEKILEQNKSKEIIVSFNVVSNVTGIITDYKKVYSLAKKYNAIVALDAAAASSHMNVDCKYFDVLFLSPHKLLGGVGSSGVLIIKKDLHKSKKPTFACGGTVSYVSRTSHLFLNNIELIEDGGTPGIIQFIKAGLAYQLRNNIGLENIIKRENELKYYFWENVKKIKDIKLYCPYEQNKVPIFSLNYKNIPADLVSMFLSKKYNIQTRSGCNCAGPYGHDLLHLQDNQIFTQKPGWVRISFHFSNTIEEIDILINALKYISNHQKEVLAL